MSTEQRAAVEVRRAVAADAEALTGMVQSSGAYQGRYAPIISGHRVEADCIARYAVFLAEDPDGRLLGFCSPMPDLDPPEPDLAFVLPAHGGRAGGGGRPGAAEGHLGTAGPVVRGALYGTMHLTEPALRGGVARVLGRPE